MNSARGGALLLPVLDGSRPALQIASAQRRLLAAERLRPTGCGRVDDVHPTLESTQPTASRHITACDSRYDSDSSDDYIVSHSVMPLPQCTSLTSLHVSLQQD